MFEDIMQDVMDKYNSTRYSYSKLSYIERKRDALYEKIVSLRNSLREMESRDIDEQAGFQALDTLRYGGKPAEILREKAVAACSESKEFDDGFFIDRIRRACTKEAISLDLIGNQLMVNILLDETAGSISQYADAIKAVREQLNEERKSPKPSRELASHFWKEKLYGPAREGKKVTRRKFNRKTKEYEDKDVTEEQVQKYWNTMQERMIQSGGIAPFWEILDKGTPFFEESFSDGGTAYPMSTPTFFTMKAIREIQQLWKDFKKEEERLMYRELNRMEDRIEEGMKMLEEIDAMIADIQSIDEEALLMEKIGERIEYCDREKVTALINEIKSGRIENFHLVGENKRIELTGAAGRTAGIRVRPYIADIAANMGTEY